jgi:hypothetical protein
LPEGRAGLTAHQQEAARSSKSTYQVERCGCNGVDGSLLAALGAHEEGSRARSRRFALAAPREPRLLRARDEHGSTILDVAVSHCMEEYAARPYTNDGRVARHADPMQPAAGRPPFVRVVVRSVTVSKPWSRTSRNRL